MTTGFTAWALDTIQSFFLRGDNPVYEHCIHTHTGNS